MAVNVRALFAQHQFTIILVLVQLIFLAVFVCFSAPAPGYLPGGHPEVVAQVNYTDFQDLHVTLIVGFGFLVAFLRRYGFASFSLSLLIAAIAIEWAIIVRGLLSDHFGANNKFVFTIHGLAMADFSAAVVLISFGALIGKVTPIQAVLLTLVEVPVSIGNEWLVKTKLEVEDIGGSIVVHVFGAVFGLAAAKVLFKKQWLQSEHQGSIYHSEVFTFVGTAFLWVFWPAFNAVNLVGAERNRAIINSYVALLGSAIAAFVASQGLNKRRHFNIRHIASASLAGGVALGATANVIQHPWAAWVVGSLAGVISITGFQFGNPLIATKAGIHDTRGVFSLHALPGIFGAIASAFFLIIYDAGRFPETIKIIGTNRDKVDQALFQLAGVGITIVIAGITGVVTGVVLKLGIWQQVKDGEFFSDADFFDVPDDFDFTSKVISHIERVELQNAPESQKLLPTDVTATTVVVPAEGTQETSS